MHQDEAAELKRKWGNKACDHPHIVSETSPQGKTGGYVCITCGDSGWGRDWKVDHQQHSEDDK